MKSKSLAMVLAVVSLCAGSLMIVAGSAGANVAAAVDKDKFCEKGLDVYNTSLEYKGKGAFPGAATIAASVKASAQYAPPKVKTAAEKIAPVYAALAKIKKSDLQALSWAKKYDTNAKYFNTYFTYFANACTDYLLNSPALNGSGSSGSGSSSSDSSSSDNGDN